VKPEYRNRGIGKALFRELAIIAQEKVTELTSLLNCATDLIVGLRSHGLVRSQGREALDILVSADLILPSV
jgi:GNAT superfamily N-acetyltransferase